MILGSVDDLNTERVIGWVHSAQSHETLKVQATINNQVVGEAVADIFRPDLAVAGMGSGHCGFEIRFPNAIDVAYLPFVEIRPAGGTLSLPRTNTAGFSDYFSWLYKKYPLAGRYPSLLGGLWTDRSDATALLKARTDIGLVGQEDSGMLSRFITEGAVVLELDATQERTPAWPAAPKAGEKKVDLATAISARFFHEDTLRILRSILDDNPIAVKAAKYSAGENHYMQASGWDDLPSPAECLALVVPLGDWASIEVLRDSHRFPEFSADGVSRWTHEGRSVAQNAGVAPNVFTDVFTISPESIAIVGPGLLHRVNGIASNSVARILVLPSRQGSVRFRQQAPADELSHRSGARIWISDRTI